MKKRISTIIAVVLTLALLAGTFVMLGVQAADPTEKLTIGETEYEIYTDKEYSALSEFTAANAAVTEESEVKFTGQWSAEYRQPWKENLATPKKVTSQNSDYSNVISFYGLSSGDTKDVNAYAQSGIAIYSDMLYVNPSMSWFGAAEVKNYPMTIKWTAPEAGSVVLFDENGSVKSPAVNGGNNPKWAWLNGTANKNTTFTISKNGTVIWPLNGEDNSFTAGGESITFPDLGTIDVAVGDVISIEVKANSIGGREGLIITPAVAYAIPKANDKDDDNIETEIITISEKEYEVVKSSMKDAYKTLKADVNGKAAGDAVTSFGTWKVAFQFLNTKGYNKTAWGGDFEYKYNNTVADNSLQGILPIGAWPYAKGFGNTAVNFVDADSKLFVSAFVPSFWNGYLPGGASHASNSHITEDTAEPAWKFTYTAAKNENVVLYDTTGKITTTGTAAAPYWANESANAKTFVRIFKNGTQIWPKAGDPDVILNKENPEVAFPDLGEISLMKDDTISIVVYDDISDNASRGGVFLNPAIAEIYSDEVITTEKVTIGNNTYEVLIAEKYNARDTLWNLVKDMDPTKATAVDASNSVWQVAASVWNSKISEAYTFGNGTAGGGIQYPAIFGVATTNTTSAWNTGSYKNCVAFANNVLYVSPYFENDATASPFIQLNFVAPKVGKVVIYDVLKDITTPAKDVAPFWCWNGTKNDVEITVWKGDVKIWPTDNKTDNRITLVNDKVTFPDLGEIKVKKGDVLSVKFHETGPKEANRDVVITDLEVAYTQVTGGGVAQTDASFATEVAVLVSVITLLGAVVITTGVISKKRAHN